MKEVPRPTLGGIRIAIDRGGTFTDCLAIIPGKPDVLIKLLSNDPANYSDAPVSKTANLSDRSVANAVVDRSFLGRGHPQNNGDCYWDIHTPRAEA